jgi:hypothetical protein
MLKLIGWVVGIVLFCWATVSAFSIFSELKFLIDGWTWSVDQVPISIKAIALATGKYVSGVVGGYRELVHGLVQMLHLPKLPQLLYDAGGIAAFSIGRGVRIERRIRTTIRAAFELPFVPPRVIKKDMSDRELRELDAQLERTKQILEQAGENAVKVADAMDRRFPLERLRRRLAILFYKPTPRDPTSEALLRIVLFVCGAIVYGGLVAGVIAALFGIDYLYRHFA